MPSILCDITHPKDTNAALLELAALGLKDHYLLEDHANGLTQVGGYIDNVPKSLTYSIARILNDQIDWNEQSKIHSSYYKNGLIKIDLTKFCKNPLRRDFALKPGPGFGDISHETTKLMLMSMGDYVKNRVVIDIGCGNGILSIASSLMGAKKVIGLEIDPPSLTHAVENRSFNEITANHVELKKCLSISEANFQDFVILMNMTFEEQRFVINENLALLERCKTFISSGILSSQIPDYKNFLSNLPLKLYSNNNFNNWNSLIYTK